MKFVFVIILCFLYNSIEGQKGIRRTKWPKPPYIDGCDGRRRETCLKFPQCGWYTHHIPWCYDRKYIRVTPIPALYPQVDEVKRFFNYNNGIHLAEGNAQKIFYNTDHVGCGRLCLNSTLSSKNVRCLSFDFFEFPSIDLPTEELNRGVCILNSGYKETSRLRNVDQGYTDEELFSDPLKAGHYRLRLSNFGGYYEVRNPRGGQLSNLLDYPASDESDYNKTIIWGGSRWGIAHIPNYENGNVNQRPTTPIDCSVPAQTKPDPSAQVTYYGGYTPIDIDQHCVGLVTKNEAEQHCIRTGGSLCPNQAIVNSLEGKKIGCSYDNDPVWSAMDVPRPPTQKKFVRCCGKYSYLNFCEDQYSQSDIDFCSKFKSFHDCQAGGGGYTRQYEWGFGRLLESYRTTCKTDSTKCVNTLVQDWRPRDRCIWCLSPGTGQGECRAGSDFGVCKDTAPSIRDRFSSMMTLMCGKETTCRVAKAYPDMRCQLLNICDQSTNPEPSGCSRYNLDEKGCLNDSTCEWIPGSQTCVVIQDDTD